MSLTPITNIGRRELARRVNDGLEITLYWDGRDNTTSIDVQHTATGETISFPVRRSRRSRFT